MNSQQLIDNARKIIADGKGLLAMDESNPTCNNHFAKWSIPQAEEIRRSYRESRLTEYFQTGVRFAKWRALTAVLAIVGAAISEAQAKGRSV